MVNLATPFRNCRPANVLVILRHRRMEQASVRSVSPWQQGLYMRKTASKRFFDPASSSNVEQKSQLRGLRVSSKKSHSFEFLSVSSDPIAPAHRSLTGALVGGNGMQGNTVKACIHATAPYLSHLLKLDNLCPFCTNVSEEDLHGLCLRFYVAILVGPALR